MACLTGPIVDQLEPRLVLIHRDVIAEFACATFQRFDYPFIRHRSVSGSLIWRQKKPYRRRQAFPSTAAALQRACSLENSTRTRRKEKPRRTTGVNRANSPSARPGSLRRGKSPVPAIRGPARPRMEAVGPRVRPAAPTRVHTLGILGGRRGDSRSNFGCNTPQHHNGT
jgi:hypothetical protein